VSITFFVASFSRNACISNTLTASRLGASNAPADRCSQANAIGGINPLLLNLLRLM
jgi:hypothetical protein